MSNFKMKGSQFYGTTCMCNSDSPLKETGKVAGENTSKLKKDSKDNLYSLIMEDTKNFAAGDTIRPSANTRIKNGYIIGGDYTTKKVGNKNYKITGDAK